MGSEKRLVQLLAEAVSAALKRLTVLTSLKAKAFIHVAVWQCRPRNIEPPAAVTGAAIKHNTTESHSLSIFQHLARVRGACNRDAWFARGRSEPIHPL